MAKYTDKQLKEMADDFLYAYNSGDQKADILLNLLMGAMNAPLDKVLNQIHKYSNYKE